MKFIRFRKKEKVSQDSDYKSIVEKILENDGSGTHHLYRKTEEGGPKGRVIGGGEIKDLRDQVAFLYPDSDVAAYGDYYLVLDNKFS